MLDDSICRETIRVHHAGSVEHPAHHDIRRRESTFFMLDGILEVETNHNVSPSNFKTGLLIMLQQWIERLEKENI